MLEWPTTKDDCDKDIIQSYDDILLLIQDRAKVIKRQPYFVMFPFQLLKLNCKPSNHLQLQGKERHVTSCFGFCLLSR